MGKTRPIYGRFTRGLKPHEAAKGEGFTPELWRKVDVTGKPILVEHDWRNPGPVGTFIRNWVEYDQKTDEHWCCIEGEIDEDGPHGPKVISDIKAGKYPAWSVSLIQSNPQLVADVGNNREFLEGSLTNDPAETGTQVIVRHNGKGGSVPVTAVPMNVSLEPMQAPAQVAEPKTEAAPAAASEPATAVAPPSQAVETQQKASDTLTKHEAQPLAASVTTVSLEAPPVPPIAMADSSAKTASAEQANATSGTAAAAATTTGQPNANESTKNATKVNLAPPKKVAESEKKETPKKVVTPPAPKEDEIMQEKQQGNDEEQEQEQEEEEEDTAEEIEKQKEATPAEKAKAKAAETKKAPAAATTTTETKKDANPIKDALNKFASADPKNAELVVALMTQLNEVKAESAKMRQEREAEKAAQAAEKARLDQIRLKEAAEKYNFWAKNIDDYLPDIPAEEKDMVRQVFESDHSEAGNKTMERLVDRLTEALASSRQQVEQLKKARTNTGTSPSGLSEAQLKSALEQLSNEFGGKTSSTATQEEEEEEEQQQQPVKRKQTKKVALKEPRDLAPTEIMVRHSKVLAGLDSKSATARALAGFGDRTEIDINAHRAALDKKIEQARLKRAQA